MVELGTDGRGCAPLQIDEMGGRTPAGTASAARDTCQPTRRKRAQGGDGGYLAGQT